MKNNAFTLIEVLIVVLIIGILAAISVTQYNKSVLKSRFSSLIPIAKSVYDGQEVFYLSNGKYTNNLANLDMLAKADVSGTQADINGVLLTMENNSRHAYVKATKNNLENNYIMYQSKSKYFPNEIHCEAKTDNSIANWLCKSALGGEKLDRSLTEGYNDYVINGDGNGFFPKDFTNLREDGKHLKLSDGDTCTGDQLIYSHRGSCTGIDFYNDSACYGKTEYTCQGNNFFDSTCYVKGSSACYQSTFSTNSLCVADLYGGCNRNTFINSTCKGIARSCVSSTFNDSTCYGNGFESCTDATFKGSSSCYGDADRACAWNSWGSFNRNVFEDNSSCYGNNASACKGVVFKGNSICYANEDGACGGSVEFSGVTYETVYEDNACCKGKFCPEGVPECRQIS